MQRLHVFFTGRVQGVGFRYTCRTIAAGRKVTGWVRNRSDGRVELIGEGEKGKLESFLSAIIFDMGDNIQKTEVAWEMATKEYEDFVISATF